MELNKLASEKHSSEQARSDDSKFYEQIYSENGTSSPSRSTDDSSEDSLNSRRNRRSKEVSILPEDVESIQNRSESRQQAQQHVDIVTEEPSKPLQPTNIVGKHIRNWPNLINNEYHVSRCSSIAEIHVVPDKNNTSEHSIPSNKIIFYKRYPSFEGELAQSRLNLIQPCETSNKDIFMDYNSILEERNNQIIGTQTAEDGGNKNLQAGNIKIIFIIILAVVSTAAITSFMWNLTFFIH